MATTTKTKKTAAKKKPTAKKTASKATAAKADAPAADKKVASKATSKAQSKTSAKTTSKATTRKAPAAKVAAKATVKSTSKAAASSKKKTATAAGTTGKETSAKTSAAKATTKKKAVQTSTPTMNAVASNAANGSKLGAVATTRSGHYMDKSQLEHFSKLLAEWKQQLMEEVDRTVDHMKDDATNFPDPNDRATQEEEFSLELRTRDRERKLIKKINEAQRRIDDEEYGYCESCGIEIGVARLEARLTAELCIDCKTLEEIRERQIA